MPPDSGGIMKPDITFFGEALPNAFSQRLLHHDRFRTDLVIVIGTSLKVAPVSELVPFLQPHIPQIYISRTPISHHNFDIDLLGDCDVVVAELCRRAGWNLDHEMVPKDQILQITTEPGWQSRHIFKTLPLDQKKEEDESKKGIPKEVKAVVAEEEEEDEFRTPLPVVTTTRSGRRSGRGSPK